MKTAVIALLALPSFSAFATELHFTDVSRLDTVLSKTHAGVKAVNEHVTKEYAKHVSLPKAVQVVGVYSDAESNLKKVSIRYSLFIKRTLGYLSCEAVLIVEKSGQYTLTDEACDM